MIKLAWLFPLFLCLAGCSQLRSSPQSTLAAAPTTDEYAIYAFVMNTNWSGQPKIVVADTTDIHNLNDVEGQINGNLPGLEKATLSQFLLVNKQEYPLKDRFQR